LKGEIPMVQRLLHVQAANVKAMATRIVA